MKITYNWLKEFVELKIAPQALAQKLTMAGLEVTSQEAKDGDFVFEIEVTSNRPDCLSVVGIAREVAAITNRKLRVTSYELRVTKKQALPFKIEIENKKDCPLYTAKLIRDVKVGPSPDWLKKRLELIGCRSVNNVVDITNYVLFVWGEPLHAFDLDKFSCQLSVVRCQTNIVIRRAKNQEEITTIDGIKRTLDENILIIAAETGRPIAIAGIMGGKDTEVNLNTKNIILEAAVFNPIIVRRARQRLGIQTDSSYRFERGIDLEIVESASQQVVDLIQRLAGGSCVLARTSGLPRLKIKSINLELSAVNKSLGINIQAPKIKKILNSLEFKTKKKTKDCLGVQVPSHRQDVNLETDLMEEIARIFGYENIPQTLPRLKPEVSAEQTRSLISWLRNILVGLGLQEVITYSLIAKDLFRNFESQAVDDVIEILNPLSREQEILRPKLIPSLLRCVAYNLNQKQDYVHIFELAKVFLQSAPEPKEELRLACALCGTRSLLFEQGLVKDTTGLLHIKGILEVLFGRLEIRGYNFKPAENREIAVYVAEEKIGSFSQLPKNILERLDIKNKDVFVLELSLDRLLSFVDLNKKFTPLPIYPWISRDISLVLPEKILAGELVEAIKDKGKPLLREVKIVDFYKGKQIPSGFKGLTLSCVYRLDERTLTEAEVNPVHTEICAFLRDRFGAQIRSCPPAPST